MGKVRDVNTIQKRRGVTRLVAVGSFVALASAGALAAPASASGGNMESILGGHLSSQGQAQRIADQAKAKGFKTHVQKIRSGDWEAEIFNGGTTKQADAVCAKARAAHLPHCSVEREEHGNGWGH